MKFNQIHKGAERQEKNKQVRKNQMFKKYKKRVKDNFGSDVFEEHKFDTHFEEEVEFGGKKRKVKWNLSSFKTTGSPDSKKKYKDWDSKKRKSEKQKWKKDFRI